MSKFFISAIGQDSHRFVSESNDERSLVLAGIKIESAPALQGNSDADVVLHALCNAISGLSAVPILGAKADALCQAGVTDSKEYVRAALATLDNIELTHLSFSIEALRPKLADHIISMRRSIADLVNLPLASVAITATSGEGLTAYGRGDGIQCFCIASALRSELAAED